MPSVSGAKLIDGISSVSSVRSGTSPEQSSPFPRRMVGFDYTNRLTREIGIAWERSVVKRPRKDHQLCKGRPGLARVDGQCRQGKARGCHAVAISDDTNGDLTMLW